MTMTVIMMVAAVVTTILWSSIWPMSSATISTSIGINNMASCGYRTNFYYNATALLVISNISIVRCLQACLMMDGCMSFNFGQHRCWLLDDFLCSNDTNTLTYDDDMQYCDLIQSPVDEYKSIQSTNACLVGGRCDRRCVCVTVDRRVPCKFPFAYNDGQNSHVYQACTKDKFFSSEDRWWCSVKVNSFGYYEFGDEGYCAPWCPMR